MQNSPKERLSVLQRELLARPPQSLESRMQYSRKQSIVLEHTIVENSRLELASGSALKKSRCCLPRQWLASDRRVRHRLSGTWTDRKGSSHLGCQGFARVCLAETQSIITLTRTLPSTRIPRRTDSNPSGLSFPSGCLTYDLGNPRGIPSRFPF